MTITILSLLGIIIVLLSGSWLPRLNGFSSGLVAHDLVYAPVELRQRLTLVFLEFIPKKSYHGDCCHHHPILLGIMYCRQLVIEALALVVA